MFRAIICPSSGGSNCILQHLVYHFLRAAVSCTGWEWTASTVHQDQHIFLTISRSVILRMRNVSDKCCTENKHTHFRSTNYFRKSCHLADNVEKYGWAGQPTADNMAHAHFTLGTLGYKNTLSVCNTYCCSTATKVARTRLNVTLHLHGVSRWEIVTCGWSSIRAKTYQTDV
jgi:hypothetical protein